MFNKNDLHYFLTKVPALKNPFIAVVTILYILVLSFATAVYFYFINRITWFSPLLSQLLMALIVSIIGYFHIKTSTYYRKKYKELAYQYHFFHFMVPYLVAWYACFFHPLAVSGNPIMPDYVAIIAGISCILIAVLASIHIEKSGFKTATHGMDIFSIFPEETTVVHGDIYSFIRHPLCFTLIIGAIGLALFKNNWLSISTALMLIIPSYVTGKIEDHELIQRYGDQHKKYINETAMLFPVKKLFHFFGMLLFIKKKAVN